MKISFSCTHGGTQYLHASQCMPHVNHQLSTDPKQSSLATLTLAPTSMSLFTTSQCPLKLAANNGLPPSKRMRQKSKQLHIQWYFECYTRVEFIFNDLELAVKLNNTTTNLQMAMLCYTHHQYMRMYCTSVYNEMCKRLFMQGITFLISLLLNASLCKCGGMYFSLHVHVHVNISIS